MKYTTALTGLEFYAYHGLYPEEQILGQLFKVDVTVTMVLDKPVSSIEDAVNYEIIFDAVKEEMATRQALIETVGQRIIARLKSHFDKAVSVDVTIYKPNPAGVFKSGVASVRITD